MSDKKILLETKSLKKYFHTPAGELHAVDDVNMQIMQGQTLGVVGESGCGKSTLGRTILRLSEPNAGQIFFDGKDILKCGRKDMQNLRTDMQIIFQDPYASLNPRMTVSETIGQPMMVNKICRKKSEVEKRVAELMDTVGLASRLYNAYPHELDGGRRQRIGIARALSVSPEFIVCDEAVSALDVSIQAQVLQLLKKLQEERGLTYMFITHDLSVVEYISDRIVVMYLGRMVEMADTQELFENTLHPYTRALLSAIPIADIDRRRKRIPLQGDVPSPVNPPSGCPFHPRCPECMERCKTEVPHPVIITRDGREHMVCCHRVQANAGGGNDFKTHI